MSLDWYLVYVRSFFLIRYGSFQELKYVIRTFYFQNIIQQSVTLRVRCSWLEIEDDTFAVRITAIGCNFIWLAEFHGQPEKTKNKNRYINYFYLQLICGENIGLS